MERFTCSRDRKTGVDLVAVCEPAKNAPFSYFSGWLNRREAVNSTFLIF